MLRTVTGDFDRLDRDTLKVLGAVLVDVGGAVQPRPLSLHPQGPCGQRRKALPTRRSPVRAS